MATADVIGATKVPFANARGVKRNKLHIPDPTHPKGVKKNKKAKPYARRGLFEDFARLNEDPKPGEEFASNANEDDDSGDEEEDLSKREQFLKEGRDNAWQDVKQVKPAPEEVANISKDACHVLCRSWDEGIRPEFLSDIQLANAKIRRLNRRAKREIEEHTIPEQLFDYIQVVCTSVRKWETSDGDSRKDATIAVVSAVNNGMPLLKQCGLSYKSIVTREWFSRIEQVMNKANDADANIAQITKYFSDEFAAPSLYQASIASAAKAPLIEFFDEAPKNLGDAKDLIKEIEEVNGRLVQSNQDAGFKLDDHLLPTEFFKALIAFWEKCDKKDLATKVESGRGIAAVALRAFGYEFDLVTPEVAKSVELDPYYKKELQGKLLTFQAPFEDPVAPTSPSAHRSAEGTIRGHTILESDDPTANPGPSAAAATKATATPDATSEPKSTSAPEVTTEDLITQWGQVVFVHTAGMGYRVIFNKGSSRHPVLEMRPGSCLPPGKAKRLELYFNGKRVKRLLHPYVETRTERDMKKGTDIAELVEGNVTRFRVRWKSSSTNDGALPRETFPTRTELWKIMGKQAVDGPGGEREKARKRRDDNVRYIEKCRGENVDPDTGRKLTQHDRARRRWECEYEPDSDQEDDRDDDYADGNIDAENSSTEESGTEEQSAESQDKNEDRNGDTTMGNA